MNMNNSSCLSIGLPRLRSAGHERKEEKTHHDVLFHVENVIPREYHLKEVGVLFFSKRKRQQ